VMVTKSAESAERIRARLGGIGFRQSVRRP
jgi:hypothetical protein